MPYWNLSVCCPTNCKTNRIYQDSVRILHNFHRNTEKHVELLNSIRNISQEWQKKKKKDVILVQTTQLPQASLNCTMYGEGGTKRHTVRLTAVFEQQHAVGQSHIFSSAIAVKLWNTGIAPADRAALRTKSTRALALRNSNLIALYR